MPSYQSNSAARRRQAEKDRIKELERIDDLLDDTRREAQARQRQIDAQAGERAALASTLRSEADVRYAEYDKGFSEMQSDWSAFEDRQTNIVERKTEADAARDAKWKGVVDEAERNPLTEFQNTEGNLDLKGYQAAKDAGWTARNISDYTKVGSYTQGMTMGDEARKQYDIDIAQVDTTWKDIKQKPLTDLNDQIKKPLASLGAGHTYSSVVSKGGNIGGGEGLKISPGKGPTDINALKRKSWKPPGKASNSSSVNV